MSYIFSRLPQCEQTRLSHLRIVLLARQIKSIFHKNRAFGDTSMKFGMEAQNTQLL